MKGGGFRFWVIAAVLGLQSAIALAGAKVEFSAYEGPAVIKTGEGGTRIRKNDIDYWTSGTPPRRYQVIGMVQDKRDEEWDGGHAIGSRSVAAKVKKAGGDAVIVQSQEEAGKGAGVGYVGSGMGFLGLGGSKTITIMLVVKYLPDAAISSDQSPAKQ